jgi:HTH-type transcriptional regulator / antitoxin HigA
MLIKPIRNDDDHNDALVRIEALWGANIGTPESDELDVLATLVDTYERSRWPSSDLDPIEALTIIMEQQGRSQSDLATLLGSRSRASEILHRKRALTTDMIFLISRGWQIPADLLVKPYALAA